MKKLTLMIVVLFIFASVTPASAGRERPTVGQQISIYPAALPPPGEFITFDAGAPFFISHGWTWQVGMDQAIGAWDFILHIDGEPVPGSLRYIQPTGCGPGGEMGCAIRIYNFPAGMSAGTYTFEGFWYISCQYGPDPASCTDPNEPVLSIYSNATIIFTQP